jgi:Holliday junction resolvasome RuvABC ATP-dependent DNA helicase subunit
MKKQTKQQPVIDLDTFEDVSLFQMIPSGQGFGQSMLKIFVDSVLNGNGKLTSLLIVGKAGLTTHASAFLRALGIDNINQTYAAMFSAPHDIYTFFCSEPHEGYIINSIHNIGNSAQYYLCQILKKQVQSL